MPNRRPTGSGGVVAVAAIVLLVAGCNRLGEHPASTPIDAMQSLAALASQPVPSTPTTPSAAPSHAPLPTFDADLRGVDDALNGTSDALGAAGGADSEGNLK